MLEDRMVNIGDLDTSLLLWVNHPAGKSSLLDKLAFDVTDSLMLKGGLFMALYWWLWFDRKGAWRRDVVVGLAAAIITAILSRGLQIWLPFHRRPLHTPNIGLHLPLTVDPGTLNTFSSFPSDHAMLFFALCIPLWKRSRWLGAAAMLWTVLVIDMPRIYLGYHYPTDVLAGAVLGVLCMLILSALFTRTTLAERVVKIADMRPAPFYALAFVLTFELATLFGDVRHLLLDAFLLGKMLIA